MSVLTPFLLLGLLVLFSASSLSCVITALQRLGRLQVEGELENVFSRFLLKYYLKPFFGNHLWEGLLFALNFTRHLLRVSFVLIAFFALTSYPFFAHICSLATQDKLVWDQFLIGLLALTIVGLSLTSDFLASLFGQVRPWQAFRSLAPFVTLILLLCSPLTSLFFLSAHKFLKKKKSPPPLSPSFRIRDRVQEILQESELITYLSPDELKSILSLVSFKERIAREVMVPRIDILSLPIESSLEEAAEFFLKEGYSRIPVYKNSIDNIIGVLHYKDVFKTYVEHKGSSSKISSLVKPVLYTPETKRLSHLLQEFRIKQIHLAIVVDEWGGTEGVVTIEDILEELVGEIADEHDVAYQELFTPIPGGGWIVDAKMAIVDIREELGIQIPQGPEYDTIGGYIFHRAGAIPSKGWRIHHDDFDLEVLSSNARAIEKIRIMNLSE